MKKPVKIAMVCLACNVIFNMLLTPLFAHVGLAMATSLSSLLNVAALTVLLRSRQLIAWKKIGLSTCLRIVFAAGLMGGVLLYAQGDAHTWLAASWLERAIKLLVLVCLGFGVYAGSLGVLGLRPRHFKVQQAPL